MVTCAVPPIVLVGMVGGVISTDHVSGAVQTGCRRGVVAGRRKIGSVGKLSIVGRKIRRRITRKEFSLVAVKRE